jgi:carbon monoxide dehydrogenase subunit G
MAVKIEKSFQVQEPVEQVWAFLSDPRKVVTCVPGAQITDQVDEKTYKGTISVKVGPSVTDYKGEVEIVKLDPQGHEIEILGKGQDVRGKGSASMKMTGRLTALPQGGTKVVSVSELNVVGILAQMGSRVINEVSNIMFEKFMKDFQQKIQASPDQIGGENQPSAQKPVNAVSVAFSVLKNAVTRHGDKSNSEETKDASGTEKQPPSGSP